MGAVQFFISDIRQIWFWPHFFVIVVIGYFEKIILFFFPREILDREEEMVNLAPPETLDPLAHLDHQDLEEWV